MVLRVTSIDSKQATSVCHGPKGDQGKVLLLLVSIIEMPFKTRTG